MKNPAQLVDTISEMAIVVPFVGRRGVEYEPRTGHNLLDAAIDLGGQRVLVEVLGPRAWAELDLGGPRKVPLGRLLNKILDKVGGQLPDPDACGDPIVLAIDTSRSEMTRDDVENSVLGPLTYAAYLDRDAGEVVGGSASRDAEKSMHRRDPRSDSISAVVSFEPTMSGDMSAAVVGTMIENTHARVPLAPAARDALARVLRGMPLGGGGCAGKGARQADGRC